MPNIPGDVLAARARQICQKTPIILCTGFSDRIGEADFEDLGVTEFLYKPVRRKALAQAVRAAINEIN